MTVTTTTTDTAMTGTTATATTPPVTSASPAATGPLSPPPADSPAPGPERSTTEWTGARSPAAAGEIGDARGVIDNLDERIIGLIRERMEVSGRIQRARIASGGRRVHLTREMEVLRHYGDAFGRPGTDLAMTLLELGRGRI
ncbi:chorismate mutase [Streptomyces sp. ST2-7A]|uniref:chorismate mutase n=1 Tax=Streptomyces sp. ST2-7A TaxID=2907214 RepID=UPI001F1BE0D2|nr:chorismate mutase [Streptomyces sp. ST2-7A]MCE7078741.1 chorismate mutase [Streptomyces sp. ST2-7A]